MCEADIAITLKLTSRFAIWRASRYQRFYLLVTKPFLGAAWCKLLNLTWFLESRRSLIQHEIPQAGLQAISPNYTSPVERDWFVLTGAWAEDIRIVTESQWYLRSSLVPSHLAYINTATESKCYILIAQLLI